MKMPTTLTEKILESKARVAKLEQQQRENERKKREKKCKEDIRRQIIIGGYLVDFKIS
jgi:very-short-patch-repair endonuclease